VVNLKFPRCVLVYIPVFAGTYCKDGKVELTWVAGYMLRWFVCHGQQLPIQ